MFNLEAFWTSQDRRGHYKEMACWSFHSCCHDWPTHLPRLLSCRRWDLSTPMAVTSALLSNVGGIACRSWLPKLDPLKETGRAEQAHLHPHLLYSQNHMRSGWLCSGVQCKVLAPSVSWGLTSFSALHKQALSHTTSEPSLISSAQALIAGPAFTATCLANLPKMKSIKWQDTECQELAAEVSSADILLVVLRSSASKWHHAEWLNTC